MRPLHPAADHPARQAAPRLHHPPRPAAREVCKQGAPLPLQQGQANPNPDPNPDTNPNPNPNPHQVRGCPYSRGKLLGTQVALVASPLEDLELPQKADVLIMISLLQSVRDVPRAMQASCYTYYDSTYYDSTYYPLLTTHYSPLPRATQAAYRAIRPGGVIVFSERAFDERWEAYTRSGRAEAAAFWDVGHPCAVKLVVLEHFIGAFREMYRKRHMHPTSHGPPDEQIYFVGRKPRNTQKAARWAAKMEAIRNASGARRC